MSCEKPWLTDLTSHHLFSQWLPPGDVRKCKQTNNIDVPVRVHNYRGAGSLPETYLLLSMLVICNQCDLVSAYIGCFEGCLVNASYFLCFSMHYSGIESSSDFHDVNHSAVAMEQLATMKIGRLKT